MKVLYANPIFLNYRLPFYKRLNELFNGDFYIMYSVNRYKGRYDKLLEEIITVMGYNAIPYTKELLYNTYERSFKKYNIEKGKKIPFTRGLIREIRKIKPDVLITEGFYQWTPLLVLYSIIYRKPLFMGYERTPHTERNCSIIKKIHRKITNLFIDGYLVNGSETQKYLLSLGIPEEKIHIGGMSADSKGLLKSISQLSLEDKNICSKYNLKDEFFNKALAFFESSKSFIAISDLYRLKYIDEHNDDRYFDLALSYVDKNVDLFRYDVHNLSQRAVIYYEKYRISKDIKYFESSLEYPLRRDRACSSGSRYSRFECAGEDGGPSPAPRPPPRGSEDAAGKRYSDFPPAARCPTSR